MNLLKTVEILLPPKITGPIIFSPEVPIKGQKLVITCHASGIPPPSYMFRKDNTDLREKPTTKGEYIIPSVKYTDEGDYQCDAMNWIGSDSMTGSLKVKSNLVISPKENPFIVDLTVYTKAIIFSCKAPNKKAKEAQLKWFDNQDNEVIATYGKMFIQFKKRSLRLYNMFPREWDNGNYTCKSYTDGSSRIELMAYLGVTMSSPTTQYAIAGTDARVWCSMIVSNQKVEVIWYKMPRNRIPTEIETSDKYSLGYERALNEEDDYLEIKNVTESDAGNYACTVIHLPYRRFKTHDINVIVLELPKITNNLTFEPDTPKGGDKVVLRCNASGKPRPTYMFTKDHQNLLEKPKMEGEYIINNMKPGAVGLYRCNAINIGGSATTDAYLQYKTKLTILPPIKPHVHHVSKAVTKQRVAFSCQAPNQTPEQAELKWFGPNGQIRETSGPRLIR
ncbi:contactin-2-like [Littorina saxatilis]|uniref:contactin-2-like n=1 Tax=Littorina saxatilis TaxID=31220 RepID=UPI0038B5C439